MKTRTNYILYPVIFISACLISACFDSYYRQLVIECYLLSTNGNIHFVGKYFLFFPSEYFIFCFGLYCTVLSFVLLKKTVRNKLIKLAIALFTFFLSIAAICYVYSNKYIMECTACDDGVRKLRYAEVPYDAIFIESLSLSLLIFLVIVWFSKNRNTKNLA